MTILQSCHNQISTKNIKIPTKYLLILKRKCTKYLPFLHKNKKKYLLSKFYIKSHPPLYPCIHASIGAYMLGRCAHAQCKSSKKGYLQTNNLR